LEVEQALICKRLMQGLVQGSVAYFVKLGRGMVGIIHLKRSEDLN